MGFKDNLKNEIAYQGLMIKEVAGKAGLSPGTMSNYIRENCSVPSADIAVRIAKALNVSVEYLVLGSDSKYNDEMIPYDADIRKMADKLKRMSERDRFLVESLIEAIEKGNTPDDF